MWVAIEGIMRHRIPPDSNSTNVTTRVIANITMNIAPNRPNASPTPPNGLRVYQANTNTTAAIGGASSAARSKLLNRLIGPCGVVGF